MMLFCLIASIAQAQQQQQMRDVVYLKNGSIIKGIIIEQVPNKSIKIQITDGSVFVYTLEEIEKMAKEIDNSANNTNSYSNSKSSGYTGIFEVNYLAALTSGGGSLYGIRYINALRTSQNFSIGLGTGINSGSGATQIPIFLDMRANFSKGNVTPFWLLNTGYCLGLSNTISTGMLGSGFGVKVFIAPAIAWHINLGYELQVTTTSNSYQAGTLIHLVGIKTGISF